MKKTRIALLGYMGSGKTTIARHLANLLGLPLIDLDYYIENLMGKSVASIFEEKGELRFRQMERKAVLDIAAMEDNFVLSTGGGTPVYYDNIEILNQNFYTFYLRSTPAALLRNIENDSSERPLITRIAPENRLEFIAKHLFERANFYSQADFTIATDTKSIEEIAEEIENILKSIKVIKI